ncbi:MAG: BamA/TamA family outer membrane protein [Burkholderiaceae bacterium]
MRRSARSRPEHRPRPAGDAAPGSGRAGLMRAACAALACSAALLLGGCAAIKNVLSPQAAETPASAPSPVRLEVDAPGPLERLLRTHLDLARLPRLAVGSGVEIEPAELDRLVAVAPEQVRELLATEGYFDPEVEVARVPDSTPPTVRIVVRPGAPTRVDTLDLQARGPLVDAARQGDRSAGAALRGLQADWPLPTGALFRNDAWVSAKRASIAGLRAQGYVDSRWASTQAQVDASTQRAALTLLAESGSLYLTGPLQIEGLNVHDAQTVRNLAAFPVGSVATEERLLDYQERLQKSGLFERATVQLDPDAKDPAAAPVQVRLAEAPLQDATVGLGFKTDEGLHGTLEHQHRRAFGLAATSRNKLELSAVRQAWEGELSTHTLPGLYRNLVGGAAERLVSDDDVVTSARLRLGRAQSTKDMERLYFVQAERSQRRTDTTRETSDALSAHYHGIWRSVDDNLLPTRGHVYSGQVGAGVARSNVGESGPFARAYAQVRGYWPIGAWYGQGRLELGQVFARDGVIVPESMRFRAGGDNSVRGYAYRSLTPIVNGVEASGRVLFTASAEIARPILQRLPQLWGAAFIDVGRAADRWGDLRPAVGVGVGLRYRSPVGPLNVDIAYGQEVHKLRLHLTLGSTF